jgi:hypothetical protein
MHVEDERRAARFAEASVSEPNSSRVHELRRRGLVTVLDWLVAVLDRLLTVLDRLLTVLDH